MDISLSGKERKVLIEIAKNAIFTKETSVNYEVVSDSFVKLIDKCGVFVSVYIKTELRGCVGRFESKKPLYELVALMAVQSAYYDTRFKAVASDEFDDLLIELSVISPFKQIYGPDEFVLGKHGIYIKQGFNSGTFLPQVADKTGWTTEEFFGRCSRDKAGIGWDGWKSAELFVFTAEVFKG